MSETPTYLDAEGNPVFILFPEGETPFTPDLEDFLVLSFAFGSRVGGPTYNAIADLDDDGDVDFPDFIQFAESFGSQAVTRNGQPIAAGKPGVEAYDLVKTDF